MKYTYEKTIPTTCQFLMKIGSGQITIMIQEINKIVYYYFLYKMKRNHLNQVYILKVKYYTIPQRLIFLTSLSQYIVFIYK